MNFEINWDVFPLDKNKDKVYVIELNFFADKETLDILENKFKDKGINCIVLNPGCINRIKEIKSLPFKFEGVIKNE